MATSLNYLITAATASGTGGGSPISAFDLNTGSSWLSTSSGGFPKWVQAQFDQPVKLTSYLLTPYDAGHAPKDWVVAGSNDGSSWTTVDTVTGAGSGAATYTVDTPGNYSYYRWTISLAYNATFTGLLDLGLTGDLSIPSLRIDTNLAPHITASSATSTGGGAVANLFDGDTATLWTSASLPASVQVTLDAPTTVYRYTVAPTAGGTGAPKNFTLNGSADGSSWTTIDTRTNITAATFTFFVASPGSYQYYKLTVTAVQSNTATTIRELALLDSTITALSVSSEFSADQAKHMLLDGDYTTTWATSSGGLPGYAAVTMSRPATLKRYRLVAQGGQNWDPKDWQIQGSQDGSSWTTLNTQTNVTFVASPWSTARPGYAVSNTTAYRYYRYYVTANHGHTTTNTRELELLGTFPIVVEAPPIGLRLSMAQKQFVEAPPLGLEVSLPPVTVGTPITLIDAPPAQLTVEFPAPELREWVGVDAPPADLSVSIAGNLLWAVNVDEPMALVASFPKPGLNSVFRAVISPSFGDIVPVLRPVFTVQLVATEGELGIATVEFYYSTDADGLEWNTIFVDVELLGGITVVSATAEEDLPVGAFLYWTARVTYKGLTGDYLDTVGYTVDPTAGSYEINLNWTTTAADTDPHLWFVEPAAGQPGDEVTVVGAGFDLTPNAVTLAGTAMSVVSWTSVAATAQASTDQRVIDPVNMIIDPEHSEVVVVVPDVETPGGPLVVLGS